MEVSGPSTIINTLSIWGNADVGRELIVAIVALVFFFFSAPRGRRWLSWGPATLLFLAPLPLAVAWLFPDSPDAPRTAAFGIRFFLMASLLQSVLLIIAVSGWERISRPIPKIFLDVLRLLTIAAALIAILFEAGVRAENLFTGSAVLTAVLGFALKDTLGNVFAGLAIHAEHPFEFGDWIQYDTNPGPHRQGRGDQLAGHESDHARRGLRDHPQRPARPGLDPQFHQARAWSRRSLFVVTPYDVSPQRVQQIILEAIRGSFGVLEHPAPSVVTNDFKERGVEHWVRLFTTDFDKRDRVDGMARDRIWYALARNGIEIPVATQQIRITQLPSPVIESEETAVERRVKSLQRIGMLGPLTPEQIGRLAEENVERVYAAGEPVIRQGAPGDSLFVIMSGRVEVTVVQEGMPSVRLATLEAGDYFGEMSLMTGAPRSATVAALVETRLLEVGKESFRRILAAQPNLVEQLGAALQLRQSERAQAMASVDRSIPESQDMFQRIREFFSM
jgi:small-conductance mechanosensitive channel/CRP-like cAMP-binding protein